MTPREVNSMPIRRFVREDERTIYDRERRRFIDVLKEKQIGSQYFVNYDSKDEIVIDKDEIEEVR